MLNWDNYNKDLLILKIKNKNLRKHPIKLIDIDSIQTGKTKLIVCNEKGLAVQLCHHTVSHQNIFV